MVWRHVRTVTVEYIKIISCCNFGFQSMKKSTVRGFTKMNGIKTVHPICFVDGCDKVDRSSTGPCEMHYYRMRRTGSYHLSSYQKSLSKKLEFKISTYNCFIVTSHSRTRNGYALISSKGHRTSVHRFVYKQCFGDIPNGLMVRHKCDNKLCINPEHLILGTHQDNMNDAWERDRFAYGEAQPHNKHPTTLIKEIKRRKEE